MPDNKTRLSESEQETPDPYVGRTFDGFSVEELIGRGGMGSVYRATQLSLARSVAIKVLPNEYAEHPQFLQRFHREVDVLSRLSHPNIVTVIERGEVDGRPYLVMEYVDGTNLRDVIKAGPLPPAEAFATVRAVLSALEHAHDKGIIHRDIKPENVLVAKGGIVKVADFGLGRLLGPVDTTRLTHTHLMLGTFEYMSPEQREKAKEADERSDLYATGVVLYEMIAGELPIGAFEPLSKKRPTECDGRVDAIVQRSLEKAPDRRYQRASEMGEAVSRLLTGAPVEESERLVAPELRRSGGGTAMPVQDVSEPVAPAAAVDVSGDDDDDEAPHKAFLLAAALVAVVGVFLLTEGGILPGLLVLVVAIGLAVPWIKRYAFGEVPVARILGPLPDKFAQHVVEDPDVQLWIRKRVPGLWRDFPAGLDFDTDEGCLTVQVERSISPSVRLRFCSALGRVLEANSNGSLRRIATADEEWERTSSANGIPLVAGFGGTEDKPKEEREVTVSFEARAEGPHWILLIACIMLGLYLASVNHWRDEGWLWLGVCTVAGVWLFRHGAHVMRFAAWTLLVLAIPAVLWFSLSGSSGSDFEPSPPVVPARVQEPVVGTLPEHALKDGALWATPRMLEWLKKVTPYHGDGFYGTTRLSGAPIRLTLRFPPDSYTDAQQAQIRDAAAYAVSAWYGTAQPGPSTIASSRVRNYPPPTPEEGPRQIVAHVRRRANPRRLRSVFGSDEVTRWLAGLGGPLFPEHLVYGTIDSEFYVWSKNVAQVGLGDRQGALVALVLEETFPRHFRRSAVLWQRVVDELAPLLNDEPVPEMTPAARIPLATLPPGNANLNMLRRWVDRAMSRQERVSRNAVRTWSLPSGRIEMQNTQDGQDAILIMERGRLLRGEQAQLAAAWGAAIRAYLPGRVRILAPVPAGRLATYIDHNPPERMNAVGGG